MKYKLINKQTGEEHLCDKVVIDGFDYYVSGNYKDGDYVILPLSNTFVKCVNGTTFIEGTQKVIATNNPNINVPKVVDEVEELAKEATNRQLVRIFGGEDRDEVLDDIKKRKFYFKKGYNKSQETHPFSEEDMKSFLIFSIEYRLYNGSEGVSKTSNELLQLWKEQRPKTLYYE